VPTCCACPFNVAYKVNAKPKENGKTYKKMFHLYSLNRDEFLGHYHKRSNVETTFSMIKAKFGDSPRKDAYRDGQRGVVQDPLPQPLLLSSVGLRIWRHRDVLGQGSHADREIKLRTMILLTRLPGCNSTTRKTRQDYG
jgi:hypothetical protein